MDKVLQFEERFYNTGEPTVLVLGRSHYNKWFTEKAASYKHEGVSTKLASPAFDLIRNITPEEGATVILVNALGAYETYDDNRNGDAFSEGPYRVGQAPRCGHPHCTPKGLRGWIDPDETVVQHYKTFERFGGIYKHHVNKDPSKSLGQILFSVWNPRMHRVELVLKLQNALDPELAERINTAGEFPAVSMGCHVKWDVCSVCGHRAPTRKDYCVHARDMMRRVLESGEKCCVLNPSPRFFDISIVFRPADPTGFMLKKVAESVYEISSAELAEKHAAHAEKGAAVRKLSDIQKVLVGPTTLVKPGAEGVMLRKYREKMLSTDLADVKPKTARALEVLASYSVPEAVSTLAAHDVALSAGEFAKLFSRKVAGYEPSEREIDRIVAIQPLLREVIAQYPDVGEKVASFVEIGAQHVRPELVAKLSSMGEWLTSELTPHMPAGPAYNYHATQPAKTDLLTMTDPRTGHVYQTTRGAAMAGDKAHQRHVLAASALAALGYGAALSRVSGLRKHPMLLAGSALGLGHLTGKGLVDNIGGYRNPTYMTDQGLPVQGNTEFRKAGSQEPSISSSNLWLKLAYDYAERLPHADIATQDLETMLYGKIAHAGVSEANSMFMHPCNMPIKVARLIEGLEIPSDVPFGAPTLNLDKLAERLGALLS